MICHIANTLLSHGCSSFGVPTVPGTINSGWGYRYDSYHSKVSAADHESFLQQQRI